MAQISLKPSSKSITALIVIAVVIFFGCALGYMAAAGKLKSSASEIQAKEKKVTESKEIAQKLEQSKLDYLDARSQIRFLESSVTTEAYVPTLLKQLEYLGKSVNLKVIGIRPQAVEVKAAPRKLSSGAQAANGNVEGASEQSSNSQPGDQSAKKTVSPYDELKVEVEVEGKYMNALDFLYKLTSFPKIIAVNSVEMNPSDDKGIVGSPMLNIKMKVTAFVFKDTGVIVEPNVITGSNPTAERRDKNEAG
ncbi:MAG: type 4a pilus biogenesis protein PilO [Armatimonadota bacterium]|nr:type 4a pilus biogenesis protein PilO [bacterium]